MKAEFRFSLMCLVLLRRLQPAACSEGLPGIAHCPLSSEEVAMSASSSKEGNEPDWALAASGEWCLAETVVRTRDPRPWLQATFNRDVSVGGLGLVVLHEDEEYAGALMAFRVAHSRDGRTWTYLREGTENSGQVLVFHDEETAEQQNHVFSYAVSTRHLRLIFDLKFGLDIFCLRLKFLQPGDKCGAPPLTGMGLCQIHNGGCQHRCQQSDSYGKYHCSCRPGFRLHLDGHHCLSLDTCAAGWFPMATTKTCLLFLDHRLANFSSAPRQCRSHGGASILAERTRHSQEFQDLLAQFSLHDQQNIWIGARHVGTSWRLDNDVTAINQTVFGSMGDCLSWRLGSLYRRECHMTSRFICQAYKPQAGCGAGWMTSGRYCLWAAPRRLLKTHRQAQRQCALLDAWLLTEFAALDNYDGQKLDTYSFWISSPESDKDTCNVGMASKKVEQRNCRNKVYSVCQRSGDYDVPVYEARRERLRFDEAQAFCLRQGGSLATVHSLEEYVLLKAAMAGERYWTIGLRDEDGRRQYLRWVDGSDVIFDVWPPGQPGSGHGDCVYVDVKRYFGFVTRPCTLATPFVCRKPPHARYLFLSSFGQVNEGSLFSSPPVQNNVTKGNKYFYYGAPPSRLTSAFLPHLVTWTNDTMGLGFRPDPLYIRSLQVTFKIPKVVTAVVLRGFGCLTTSFNFVLTLTLQNAVWNFTSQEISHSVVRSRKYVTAVFYLDRYKVSGVLLRMLADSPCHSFQWDVVGLPDPVPICNKNVSHCSQRCLETLEGPVCACNPGYSLFLDGKTCLPKLPCREQWEEFGGHCYNFRPVQLTRVKADEECRSSGGFLASSLSFPELDFLRSRCQSLVQKHVACDSWYLGLQGADLTEALWDGGQWVRLTNFFWAVSVRTYVQGVAMDYYANWRWYSVDPSEARCFVCKYSTGACSTPVLATWALAPGAITHQGGIVEQSKLTLGSPISDVASGMKDFIKVTLGEEFSLYGLGCSAVQDSYQSSAHSDPLPLFLQAKCGQNVSDIHGEQVFFCGKIPGEVRHVTFSQKFQCSVFEVTWSTPQYVEVSLKLELYGCPATSTEQDVVASRTAVTQNATWNNMAADLAVDGDNATCAVTNDAKTCVKNPSWTIVLSQEEKIHRIIVQANTSYPLLIDLDRGVQVKLGGPDYTSPQTVYWTQLTAPVSSQNVRLTTLGCAALRLCEVNLLVKGTLSRNPQCGSGLSSYFRHSSLPLFACGSRLECPLAATTCSSLDGLMFGLFPCGVYLKQAVSGQTVCAASDLCAKKMCLYGGTCLQNSLTTRCACRPGFTGAYCQEVERFELDMQTLAPVSTGQASLVLIWANLVPWNVDLNLTATSASGHVTVWCAPTLLRLQSRDNRTALAAKGFREQALPDNAPYRVVSLFLTEPGHYRLRLTATYIKRKAGVTVGSLNVTKGDKKVHRCLGGLRVGGAAQHQQRATVYLLQQPFVLSPSLVSPCSDLWVRSAHWFLHYVPSSRETPRTCFSAFHGDLERVFIEDGGAVFESGSKTDHSDRRSRRADAEDEGEITVSGWTLKPGVVMACVEVAAFFENATLKHSVCGFLEVQRSNKIKAVLRGDGITSLPVDQTLTLDASPSYDEDVAISQRKADLANFRFRWRCDTVGFFITCNLQLPPQALVTLPPGSLKGDVSYVFSLLVYKVSPVGGRPMIGIVRKIVTTSPAGTPVVEIKCLQNCGAKLDPREVAAFNASCSGCGGGRALYDWFLTPQGSDVAFPQATLDRLTTTPPQSQVIVFRDNALPPGQKWQLECEMAYATFTAFGGTDFIINEAPSGGTCAFLPEQGVGMTTYFSLACTGFVDPDTPLRYKAFLLLDQEEVLLTDGFKETTSNILLPAGPQKKNHSHVVLVRVQDSFGTFTELSLTLQVLPNPKPVDVVKLAEKLQSHPSFVYGGQSDAVRMTGSIATALNDDTSSGTADKVKAREKLIGAVEKLKVKDSRDLGQMADLLSRITSKPDQLSSTSETKTVGVLEGLVNTFKKQKLQIISTRNLSRVMVSTLDNLSELTASKSPTLTTTASPVAASLTQVRAKAKRVLGLYDELGTKLMDTLTADNEEPVAVSTPATAIVVSKRSLRAGHDLDATAATASRQGVSDLGTVKLKLDNATLASMKTPTFDPGAQAVGFLARLMRHNPYQWTSSVSKVNAAAFDVFLENRKTSSKLRVGSLASPVEVTIPLDRKTLSEEERVFNLTISFKKRTKVITFGDWVLTRFTTEAGQTTFMNAYLREGDLRLRMLYQPGNASKMDRDDILHKGKVISGCPNFLKPLLYFNASHKAESAVVGIAVDVDGKQKVSKRLLKMAHSVRQLKVTLVVQFLTLTCRYWDEVKDAWETSGCTVGYSPDPAALECRCSHLTVFSGGLFVPPSVSIHPIKDAHLFAQFFVNPIVVCTVLVIWLLYFIVLAWAVKFDREEAKMRWLTVLEDNPSDGEYLYIINVVTGWWRAAGTTSSVYLFVKGRGGACQRHALLDPDRELFQTGSDSVFLMAAPQRLGNLKSIIVWIDPEGERPNWFLKEVRITDVRTQEVWHFLYNDWLGIPHGIVRVRLSAQREHEVARYRMYHVTMKAITDLRRDHLVLSIVARPPFHKFTRSQRLTCILTLLTSTMLANIMFQGIPTDDPEDQLDEFGVHLSMSELVIAMQTSTIVFVITFLATQLFMLAAPHPGDNCQDVHLPREEICRTTPNQDSPEERGREEGKGGEKKVEQAGCLDRLRNVLGLRAKDQDASANALQDTGIDASAVRGRSLPEVSPWGGEREGQWGRGMPVFSWLFRKSESSRRGELASEGRERRTGKHLAARPRGPDLNSGTESSLAPGRRPSSLERRMERSLARAEHSWRPARRQGAVVLAPSRSLLDAWMNGSERLAPPSSFRAACSRRIPHEQSGLWGPQEQRRGDDGFDHADVGELTESAPLYAESRREHHVHYRPSLPPSSAAAHKRKRSAGEDENVNAGNRTPIRLLPGWRGQIIARSVERRDRERPGFHGDKGHQPASTSGSGGAARDRNLSAKNRPRPRLRMVRGGRMQAISRNVGRHDKQRGDGRAPGAWGKGAGSQEDIGEFARLDTRTLADYLEDDDEDDDFEDEPASGRRSSAPPWQAAEEKPFCTLPWQFIYVAWTVSLLSSLICSYLVMLYGFKYGYKRSLKWFVSFFTSFMQSFLVVEPMEIFVLSVLFMVIFRRTTTYMDTTMEYQRGLHEDSLRAELERKHLKETRLHIRYVPPISKREMTIIKKRLDREQLATDIIFEIVFYFIFVAIVLLIVNGHVNITDSYRMTKDTEDALLYKNYDGDFKFERVGTVEEMWTYLISTLPSNLVPANSNMTSSGFALLVGTMRLRQVRIKKDSCVYSPKVANLFKSMNCSGRFRTSLTDTYHYGNWSWRSVALASPDPYPSMYGYQTSAQTGSRFHWGARALYPGGGYVLDLPRDEKAMTDTLKHVRDKTDWIDARTRALFVELSLYNPSANLFAHVQLLLELGDYGGVIPSHAVSVIKLYHYPSRLDYAVATCEIFFVFFIFSYAVVEARKLRKVGLGRYASLWSAVEVSIILLALSAVGVFVLRLQAFKHVMERLRAAEGRKYVSFQDAVALDFRFQYIAATLSVLVIIKFLKLFRFNKRLSIFPGTLRWAAPELLQFSFTCLLVVVSFASFATKVFSPFVKGYRNFGASCLTIYNFILGMSDYYQLAEAHAVLGPLFFFVFNFLVQYLLMMVFVTAIMEAYYQVAHDVSKQSHQAHVVDFVWKRFKMLFAFQNQHTYPARYK